VCVCVCVCVWPCGQGGDENRNQTPEDVRFGKVVCVRVPPRALPVEKRGQKLLLVVAHWSRVL
jgi:hypothetical protein